MSDILMSFIHEEAETAAAIQTFVNQMLSGQANTFLSSDKFQVYAGEQWLERIVEELSAAKIVLLVLSEKSVTRPWVNFEAGAAWLTKKKIIPLCIRELNKDNLPKPYSSLQAIDLKYTDERLYLIRSIAHHLGIKEPEIASRFGGAMAPLGGPESIKKVEAQHESLKQFDSDLKTATKIETFLEKYRADLEKGGMASLKTLMGGAEGGTK